VPQANRLPQQPDEPEASIETTVGGYQSTLKNLLTQMLSEDDWRTIQKGAIDQFQMDLRKIIKGVEDLRENPEKAKYLDSIDAIQTNLRIVIVKLYTASDVLERGDTIEDRQKFFYPSFIDCIQPLREAIQQFKP
jgi:hypothetical protein